MINNRQAGRRRGRGGNNNGGPRPNGGSGPRDSGNRIDSRARGTANQLFEKYKNLAADAQRQGDRVTTEYYLQFADHYFRVLSESRSRMEEQNQRPQRNDGYEAQPFTGSFDTGFDGQDDEFADEGEPIRANEQRLGEQRMAEPAFEERPSRNDRDDSRRANGQAPRRDDRPREDRPRAERNEPRNEQRGEQTRNETRRDEPREQVAREDGEGFTRRPRRFRDEGTPVNGEVAQAPVPVETAETALESEAPRRRGRPRRERPAEEAPAAFDAALLPPSIGVATAAPEASAGAGENGAEEKPRRRRVRATPASEVTPAG